MPRPVFLRWIQKSISIAVTEFYQTAMRKNGCLMNPLSVNVRVSISMTGGQ